VVTDGGAADRVGFGHAALPPQQVGESRAGAWIAGGSRLPPLLLGFREPALALQKYGEVDPGERITRGQRVPPFPLGVGPPTRPFQQNDKAVPGEARQPSAGVHHRSPHRLGVAGAPLLLQQTRLS